MSGCKGVDNTVKQTALAAYRKGFRVMIYELKQFADPSELEPVVQYLESTYKGAPLGLEYGANLLVRHAAQSSHYRGLVSIGNPLLLGEAEKGFKWLWKYTLEKDLIACRKKKAMITEPVDNLYDVDMIEHKLKEEDVKAFKERNSSMNYIKDLKMRALFINNKNDPFSM